MVAMANQRSQRGPDAFLVVGNQYPHTILAEVSMPTEVFLPLCAAIVIETVRFPGNSRAYRPNGVVTSVPGGGVNSNADIGSGARVWFE
jgi:hypothetical protein